MEFRSCPRCKGTMIEEESSTFTCLSCNLEEIVEESLEEGICPICQDVTLGEDGVIHCTNILCPNFWLSVQQDMEVRAGCRGSLDPSVW